jgi:ppGpp synthetase/RelA/SpoT-type nucleotidyltranferase
VTSRIKECESSIAALQRRQEAATFDPEKGSYSLTELRDLAAVRVLTFPRSRWREANDCLRHRSARFSSWLSDHVWENEEDKTGEPLAFKYYGFCSRNNAICAEIQIVPMLIGLFWQIEHSAIYKPSPQFKGVAAALEMTERRKEVYKALMDFESEFEHLVRQNPLSKS